MRPWQPQMDLLRARTATPGLVDPAHARSLSGLALTSRTGLVRAEGKVVASGKRMATAEGRLVDADGRLYSHGTTTCLLLDV